MTQKEVQEALPFASELARGAGSILRKGLGSVRQIRFKGEIDPVTEFDLKSEKFITSRIKRKYPDHEILAEEGTAAGAQSDYRWIIDPLDGTVNYAHGFPVYCVSIALEHLGEICLGVVYDPERDELFRASVGKGSYLNGCRIHVSTQSRLDRSLLATGFAYDVKTARRNNLGLFARMIKSAQAVRRAGSAAIDLCWLACGRLDGFWELQLHPWDTAAATLIVAEAGGKVSRIIGRPYSIFDPDVMASNKLIHAQLGKKLAGY
jgi:myo-inositol-1(or 4)-monophosphatase